MDVRNSGSFRDPSGYVFTREGVLYRQVNVCYREHYAALMDSGLYAELEQAGLIIPHTEAQVPPHDAHAAFKVLQPTRLRHVSYPYEWCFSQYQDAALATLDIQRRALAKGLWLKDASAYNIQFHEGRPVLVDTLSFERITEGQPWPAYRQFCQHFLAPLLLMAERDIRLAQLLRIFIDGVPLDLASSLLPWTSRLRFGALVHIHLHARAIARSGAGIGAAPKRAISRLALQALTDSLLGAVRSGRYTPAGTEWGEYYDFTNYSKQAFSAKQTLVASWIEQSHPATLWDLGANDATFSRLASDRGVDTVALDVDPAAVEKAYRAVRQRKERHLLPLLLDLTNPSPAIGWRNAERSTWRERGEPDLVLALALIHHLVIANNVPLASVADFFADLAPRLIIEFVPKADSQVQRMLATRADIFTDYTQDAFERAFGRHFRVVQKQTVPESERTLYLLERGRPA